MHTESNNLSRIKFIKHVFLFIFQEWGMRMEHKFIGGYRLEMDQTWTPLDRIGEVDAKKQITKKLIQSSNIAESFRAIAYSDDPMNS